MDVWVDSCSAKVVRFDDDHKQMFSIINGLDNAMRSGKGALVVRLQGQSSQHSGIMSPAWLP